MPRVKPIYSNTFTKRRRTWITVIVVLGLAVLVGGALWLHLRNPRPNAQQYPQLGVRLSQTDGSQDFDALKKQQVSFVYLKATEGASYFDDNFDANYSQTTGSNLRVGVYHYFSFSSTPSNQAASFYKHVGGSIGDLPLAIEVTNYTTVPKQAELTRNLQQLVTLLQTHYGVRVILMGTPTMLAKVKSVAPTAGRMVISSEARAAKSAMFWEYAADAKIPGGGSTEYHCIVAKKLP